MNLTQKMAHSGILGAFLFQGGVPLLIVLPSMNLHEAHALKIHGTLKQKCFSVTTAQDILSKSMPITFCCNKSIYEVSRSLVLAWLWLLFTITFDWPC